MLSFHSRTNKIPLGEKALKKNSYRKSPFRNVRDYIGTRLLFPLGLLTFVFRVGGHRVDPKRMPGLEVVQAELAIHGKKLHGGFGFRQRWHESIIAVADPRFTDDVGQDIVRVVLFFLQQLI